MGGAAEVAVCVPQLLLGVALFALTNFQQEAGCALGGTAAYTCYGAAARRHLGLNGLGHLALLMAGGSGVDARTWQPHAVQVAVALVLVLVLVLVLEVAFKIEDAHGQAVRLVGIEPVGTQQCVQIGQACTPP